MSGNADGANAASRVVDASIHSKVVLANSVCVRQVYRSNSPMCMLPFADSMSVVVDGADHCHRAREVGVT